jgi:glycopeptide antibiotics resistance protein
MRATRRTYGVLAFAYALFVVYGSLVPLAFRPIPLAAAIDHFTRVITGPLVIDSRTDVATNFLLLVPFGYFWMAALRTDRRGWVGSLLAAAFTIGCGFVLCSAVEFTQTFFPDRTVALSDIVAETSGGVFGATLWLVVGTMVTAWLRAFARERERPALIQRLLLAYAIAFIFSQLLPLDLTLNLGELARKYREGRITLHPFGYVHTSWLSAAWDYFGDVALNAPLGAAAVLLWTGGRSRRRAPVAIVLGVMVVAVIELAQVFVNSRYADVTDVLTGSLGVVLGVAMARTLSDREVLSAGTGRPERLVVAARVGAVAWMGAMLSYHWRPFDFTLSPEQVATGMHQLMSVPFLSYYLGPEFHAFTEMMRKSLLALPLGALLRIAWSPGDRSPASKVHLMLVAVLGFGLLLGIEVGQVFLPTRVADVTDAIVGEMGFITGMWIAGLLLAGQPQHQAESAEGALRRSVRPLAEAGRLPISADPDRR